MDSFAEQRTQVLDLGREAAVVARELGVDPAQFDAAASDLRDGRLSVAVVGEFKRGKSSLLNALIEEPELFPTNTSIATNMVTTVTYGDQERVTVVVDDPDAPMTNDADGAPTIPQLEQTISRAQIRDYVTEQGNPRNRRRARLLLIELPNDKLRDGLTFVDTPGVGGLNTEHTRVTYAYVTSADVVLFVLDALTVANTEELDFVKIVGEHCEAVIFVVTKTDKVTDDETRKYVANTRQKIDQILGSKSEEVPIIPVSSLAKLDYLETRDDEDLATSNFAALENALWSVLRERGGAIILLRALGALARGLDNVVGPIRAELDVYTERSESELEEIEHRLEETAARTEELRREEASWRRTLTRTVDDARDQILDAQFTDRQHQLRERLTALVKDERLLHQPEEIISLLDKDIALLASDLAKEIERSVDRVCEQAASDTGLVLNPVTTDTRLAAKTARPIFEPALPGTLGDRPMAVARGLTFGGTTGAGIGGLVASLLATGPVGWAVLVGGGMTLGAAQMARSQLKQVQTRDLAALRAEVQGKAGQYLERSLNQLRTQLKRAVNDTMAAIVEDFQGMLTDEAHRLRDEQAAISAARKRTKTEAAARLSELRAPLTRLERLRRDADAQAKAALAPRTDRGDWAEG